MIVEGLLLICSIILLWFVFDNYFPRKNYPPGPARLPLIGNAQMLLKDRATKPPFVKFEDLSKKYGPVCYIRIGPREVVIIHDFEMAKQMLNNEIWIDRPFNARVAERSFGKPLGIIFPSGDGWKEMRRFSMRTLRDFGYGKQTSMQNVLDSEVKALLNKLEKVVSNAKKNGTEPILPMKHLFTMPVLNILWSMVSNTRTEEDDVKLEKLIQLVDNLAKANPIGGSILALFPFLRFIFPEWTGHNFAKKCHAQLQQYFRDILEARRNEDSYQDDRDFIDMFIQEIDKHKREGSSPNYYTDEQFITTITDLFEAGSETSSNTMEFAIFYVMKSLSVQKKVQAEIDRIVGHNRYPEMGDKNRMPYTEATLLEVQRMSNVLPVTIRCPTEDCKLGGYDVAKGTSGIVNMYSIHMDPTFWEDPFTFKPERFLDDTQSKIVTERASRVIPFGAGKRVCLGEQMARTSLFVYFTSLLQNYSFLDAQSETDTIDSFRSDPQRPTSYIDIGFTLSPKPYAVKIIKRG